MKDGKKSKAHNIYSQSCEDGEYQEFLIEVRENYFLFVILLLLLLFFFFFFFRVLPSLGEEDDELIGSSLSCWRQLFVCCFIQDYTIAWLLSSPTVPFFPYLFIY
eukprot:TRINITY_DN6456_c0_g2_i1.p1 TRINITY_DN6456_c0_g2~~TRINITY_DN6456_c0_g2_i1.p1  ORF type:complete len:105 (+),score=10.81 TRINITY_DN6456_c0_g2_i1:453-767(+)